MAPGYEIQPISSGGRSQNSCPTKLEEQSNCIARIFIILYNENKAPLNLGFVHGHSSLPHFLNPSSQALNKHPVGSNGLPRILMAAFAR